MASTTLTFCSSFTTTTGIYSQKQCPSTITALALSNTNFTFLSPATSSLSSHRVTLSPIISSRSTFSTVPKSTDTEAPVLDIEPVTADSEPAQLVETSAEPAPKREEIFAVVMVGGRQYIVFPGRFIYTQRLKGANVNDKVILNKVLLIGTKTSTYIGQPIVPNATVHAVVEEQGLNDKVVVFKYKKKKNYRRNIGHRQPNTRIRITGIVGYENAPFVTLDS